MELRSLTSFCCYSLRILEKKSVLLENSRAEVEDSGLPVYIYIRICWLESSGGQVTFKK